MSKTAVNKEQDQESKCYSSILYTKKKKSLQISVKCLPIQGLILLWVFPKAGKLIACDHFDKIDWKYKCT